MARKSKALTIEERVIQAEIEQDAIKSRISMNKRSRFVVPIPSPRSIKPRPKPGEMFKKAQKARASEIASGLKRKGMNSILKGETKHDVPGQYTTGRYLKVTEQVSWRKTPSVGHYPERALFKRDGQGEWTSEIIDWGGEATVEIVDQFPYPITFGQDSVEALQKLADDLKESQRMEERLQDSIEAAEEEQERLKQEIERRDGVMAKPKLKTAPMPEWAGTVLMNAIYEDHKMAIKDQLPRDQYDVLKKIIEALGGKWDRKAKITTETTDITGAHVFSGDARGTVLDAVGKAINEAGTGKVAGIVDQKKTMSQFFSPALVAELVVEKAEIEAGMRILEPSAGAGNLLEPVFEAFGSEVSVVAVEKDPELCKELESQCEQYDIAMEVYCCDFLTQFEDEEGYDRIIMNPPFNNGEDIEHVLHAVEFLKPQGKLVAIVANGTRQEQALRALCWSWKDLPKGAFAASGTMVNAAIILITKSYFDRMKREAA